MIASREFRAAALLMFLAVGIVLVASACSGGGVDIDDDGVADFNVMVGTPSELTGNNGERVICVPFTLTGVEGQSFDLLFQYFEDLNDDGMLGTGENALNATQVSMTLANNFTPPLDIVNVTSFDAGSGTLTGTFYWDAGADLGFVPTEVCFMVDASTMEEGQEVIDGIVCDVMVEVGTPPTGSTGDNIGPVIPETMTQGLFSHTAVTSPAADDRVVIAGGVTQEVGLQNFIATDAVNRFNFDVPGRTHMSVFSDAGQNARFGHASAFFYDSTGTQRVLITGGVPSLGGSPTPTSDIYQPNPESLTAGPNMTVARLGHTACWLPNNTILIVGGETGMSSGTAEIYDPVSNTFSATTSPLFARTGHTCCLLPDGRVLVAGGSNPMGGGMMMMGGTGSSGPTPLAAEIYDPVTATWTSTGTTIDRKDHTAEMLVNGVCYLIGGRTVTTNEVLSSAHAYRTFAGALPGGGVQPAGFSSTLDPMASARTEHASTRLGTGAILVTGGFGSPSAGLKTAQDTVEIFLPEAFTADLLGMFSQTDVPMSTGRAFHTTNTVPSGGAVVVGGVTGTEGSLTALETIETYGFSNAAPTATIGGASVIDGNFSDVPVTITVNDANGDRSFVYLQFSTDGGASYNFATLTNYADAVNIAPGTVTLHWNATADSFSGGSVMLRVIPVGGVFGTPATATVNL